MFKFLKNLKDLFSKPYCNIDLGDGFYVATEQNKDKDKSIKGIYIKKDNKILFNFLALLPNYGYNIPVYFGERFCLSCPGYGMGKMEIFIKKMRTRKDVIYFLHEIGHARDIEMTEISLYAEQKYFEISCKDPLNFFPIERILAFYEDFKVRLECEERAWDYAWEVVSLIKNKFDIEIINKNEFEKIKKKSLHSYVSSYIDVAWGYIDSSIKTKEELEYYISSLIACHT